eukprot:TRINITY_DN14323_c0_g1_i1.p1 TRINITY_DN14323_c0_g1~~TRINITY_DN14323_c0_g1_i1.p1  ORF type:complete len:335 (-),score=39.38 TRINITY_DN14323_c0_g1_i1:34-1038(-)
MSSFPFIPDDATSLHGIFVNVSAGLSCLGCLFIIITYVTFGFTRQFHLKLIMLLTVTDLISSVVFLIGENFGKYIPTTPMIRAYICDYPDTVLHLSLVSSFLWTMCIAHMLVQVLRYQNDRVDSLFPMYSIISWGLPLILLVLLAVRGPMGWDCHDPHELPMLYDRLLFFVPLIVAYIFNLVCYILVSNKLVGESRRLLLGNSYTSIETLALQHNTPTILRTYRLFLLAFSVCWLWAIAIFVAERLGQQITFLYDANYVFTPLQGFLNSIVYGMNDELRANIVRVFKRFIKREHNPHSSVRFESTKPSSVIIDNEEFLRWRAQVPAPRNSTSLQ